MKVGALRLPLVALAVAVALPVGHLLLGGRDYRPGAAADPCVVRPVPTEVDDDREIQQVGLAAVDRAACSLDVDRGRLALGLLSEEGLDDFVEDEGVEEAAVERAVRDGVKATLDDAEKVGAIDGAVLRVLRSAVEVLPLRRLVDAVNGTSDPCVEPVWRPVEGQDAAYTQVGLIALDVASCTLGVAPEAFALALADEAALERFQEAEGVDDAELEQAVRDGLRRGVSEGSEGGAFSGLELFVLEQGIDALPLENLLETLRTGELQRG